MLEKNTAYCTLGTKTKPKEIFIRSENGNKKIIGKKLEDIRKNLKGLGENIGRFVYCPLKEANNTLRKSRKDAVISDNTPEYFFRESIFFETQMGNFPGGIIIYEDGNEKTSKGLPKLKRSYSLVEKVEEIE